MKNNNNNLKVLAGGFIIAIIVLGLIFYSRGEKRSQTEIIYDQVTDQSQSNNIESIEQDLLDTELESIDEELRQIEQELESAY